MLHFAATAPFYSESSVLTASMSPSRQENTPDALAAQVLRVACPGAVLTVGMDADRRVTAESRAIGRSFFFCSQALHTSIQQG